MNARRYIITTVICLIIIISLLFVYFFSAMSSTGKAEYLYIDRDDNIDSVYAKLEPISAQSPLKGFKTLARHFDYTENIKTGRYKIQPDECAITVLKHLKSGMQEPLRLTIPSVRTASDLSKRISQKLMLDSAEIAEALKDSAICAEYGYDTCTMVSMFIPNSYDVYWNITIDQLLTRMQKENKTFWNDERKAKAEQLGLSQTEVVTLASIVDEETSNNQEKPMIAGMYYNRLKTEMPLQADPTIKFAIGDFSIKRIYHKMLIKDSPYNTYKNTGLPPGPIRIPSIAGIDAVLNMVKHDYLYMCAKEDFSGTHNFAVTYEEHKQNARKYTKALNERGIR